RGLVGPDEIVRIEHLRRGFTAQQRRGEGGLEERAPIVGQPKVQRVCGNRNDGQRQSQKRDTLLQEAGRTSDKLIEGRLPRPWVGSRRGGGGADRALFWRLPAAPAACCAGAATARLRASADAVRLPEWRLTYSVPSIGPTCGGSRS